MPRSVQIFSVLIASPGDVRNQREIIHREVEEWNRSASSRTLGVRLESLRWELDAVPELGRGDAQTVINRQLRDQADIVVGIFHARLGTRTARADSGTAEEIEESARRGKRVHVFIDQRDVPRDHDPEQLQLLKEYLERLSSQGLLRDVTSDDELSRHVRLALDHDVAEMLAAGAGAPAMPTAPDSAAAHAVTIADAPAPAVLARDELNRAADAVLALEALRRDSPVEGNAAWVAETYVLRRREVLQTMAPLLERVVDAIRTGDPTRNDAWIDLIPVLAPNQHRGGSTQLLNLVRAPGALLFHLAGMTAACVRNDELVGRLLSPLISVDDPYNGFRPAVVSLRAELAFPTEWPSRELSRYLVPLVAQRSGSRASSDAWERWTYLAAVATTYFSVTMDGVWADHPYLRVAGDHMTPLRTVVARDIREAVRSTPQHPLLQGGMCNGNDELFVEAATTFEANFGEWARNQDWRALPGSGGVLPSGPHFPGERQD